MAALVIIVLCLIGFIIFREMQWSRKMLFYKILIEKIPFEAVLFDNKWRFQIISGSAIKNVETRNWLIGKTELDYWTQKRNQPERAEQRMSHFLMALEKREMVSFDEVLLNKEGNEEFFSRQMLPIFDQKGNHIACLGYGIDMTLIKNREKELEFLNKELNRSNEDLANFAQAASHDLKAPLRSIVSFLQLLERRNRAHFNDTDREFIAFISTGAKQMENLINSLLTFSRIDKQTEPPESIYLGNLLEKVKINLRSQTNDCGAEILISPLPEIKAHDFLINQLFQNLISNGIKYNKNPNPQVEVNAQINDKGVFIFSVQDNGIGIPAEFSKSIFKIFHRLHSAEKYEGSGVGLASCKRIVEVYGGEIWIESVENEGTTFFLTLPLAEPVFQEVALVF
jgi:signal transduction histidine kinase